MLVKSLIGQVFCIVLVASLSPTPATAADEDFYADKTVNIYLGRSAGSGTDLALRTFIRFWQEHIPGRPTIVVRNIPGGGGTRVWNFGYELADPDGLSILFSPFSGAAEILDLPGLRADFTSMPLIGGLKSPNLVYVRTDVISTPADLLTISGLKYAGQDPAHHYDIMARMALDMLGVDYTYIAGFQSANDVFNAIRRREVDMQTAGLTLYRFSIENTLIESGEAIPLWHNPRVDREGNVVAEEAAEGVPTFVEVYTDLKGSPPSGEMFEIYKWLQPTINTFGHAAFLPPNTPDDAARILRESFVATTNDAQYRAEEMELFGVRMPLIEHTEGSRVIREMTNAPENVRTLLRHYASPEGR
jgi:tripartite-type tricarboxylate transporter receptor subunit TctC